MNSSLLWPKVDNLLTLNGKVALVTGAGAGLGRSIALLLAGAGASVAAVDRNLGEAQNTSVYINENGGRSTALLADLAESSAAEEVLQSSAERFDTLDILVNNAGIYPPAQPLPDIDFDVFEKTLQINLHGTARFLSAAAKRMSEGGSIINISSNTSLRPSGPGIAHYCASKAAVNALTRSAAVDLAPRGIRVNAVLPGIIATEGTSAMADRFEYFAQKTPSGRIGQPEDVARAVLFLASSASVFINGQCLVVDGGASIVG